VKDITSVKVPDLHPDTWASDIATDLAITGRTSKLSPKLCSKWQLPAPGLEKVNVDASFSNVSGKGATGLVIRNHEGLLMHGQAIWYNHAASVLNMEAVAIRDGVELATDLGLSRIVVETDSSDVVKLWNDGAQAR
jgi:hypothetical protein